MNHMSIDSILENRLTGKVVIVGVGNCQGGDDGTGVSLVEKLVSSESFIPLSVGDSPEYHLFEILEEVPDVVMFVDAVDLGSPPGSVAIIEKNHLPTSWGNTHQPPLSIIMKYISEQTGADTFLLGIQADHISIGNRLSPSVKRTVKMLSDVINKFAAKHGLTVSGDMT